MPDIAAEYRIISTAAGWIDRSRGGRLRFEGRDAASFLHGLLTNDVANLSPGDGAYAALLTPQGRMVADFRLYRREGAIVADVPSGMAADLAARLDLLVFAEDVRVSDVSAASAVVTVVGRRAAETLSQALGLEPAALGKLRPLAQVDADGGRFVIRADDTEWPTFDVWTTVTDRQGLVAQLADCDAIGVSAELFDALRIEAGRPLFGVDMTTDTIPLEAGIENRAISMSKGCYVGQEIIVRVLHRGGGRVAKRLVQIALEDGRPDASDSGPKSGRITSTCVSPRTGRALALGYVSRDLAEVGTRVELEAPSGRVAGEIIGLAR